MNLTTKIFKIFTFIFLAQLAAVGLWSISLFSSKEGKYPASITSSLTKIDKSLLEGIILQNKMGAPLARDLVIYRLLELNNIDSAEFINPEPLSDLIDRFRLQGCNTIQDATICSRENNQIAVSLLPLKLADQTVGFLKLEKSLRIIEQVNRKILFTIGITVLVVFIINVFTIFMIWWKFLKPETPRLLKVIEHESVDPGIKTREYKKIQDSFLEAISKVKTAESARIQLESQLLKNSMATQLAHDIRSPLEVLKSLKEDMANFPESSRKRIQLAINRIEEITFNLLKNHKQATNIEIEKKSEQLLSLVTSIVTEKNIEFRNYSGIEIVLLSDAGAYDQFSLVQRGTLKSIISNLINNGVESFLGKPAKIEVILTRENNINKIKIRDNGPGIPISIRENLFIRGFTTKKNGNGLGLYHAKLDIESFGGSIDLESQGGIGTTFIISLPFSEAPSYFTPSIDIFRYDKAIILDDDLAFHEIWNNRLIGKNIVLEHAYSVEEMLVKYNKLESNVLLLTDFELMDSKQDGIDVITVLGHSEHSILVTARNEEFAIIERCLTSGIRILPKSLVNFVKIQDQRPTVVLIDDDRIVLANWTIYCQKHQIPFFGFQTIDGFLASSPRFHSETQIFIDSNLCNGLKGEIESEKIFNLGFSNLYLATGYEKGAINKPQWIKEIFSKSPSNIFSL